MRKEHSHDVVKRLVEGSEEELMRGVIIHRPNF